MDEQVSVNNVEVADTWPHLQPIDVINRRFPIVEAPDGEAVVLEDFGNIISEPFFETERETFGMSIEPVCT